jgi:hypothetical protein
MEFRPWLESEERQTYYHVTYWKNLDSIARVGLIRNARPNFSSNSTLAYNSERGLFLAADNVSYWVDVYENWANDRSDNIRKDGLIPIILRVRALPSKTQKDEYPGNPDQAFVYPKNIRSQYLEMWDGKAWTPNISRRGVHLDLFIEKESIEGEGTWWNFLRYPFPPELS